MPEPAAPTSTRLEAFSDGVIAIIVTIMVLELKVPHEASAAALLHMWPTFMGYALSFFLVAIYWVNHHQLFTRVETVNHSILWSNNLLLFCISLIPFATAFLGESTLGTFPVALYSGLLFVCGLAFMLLAKVIVAAAPGGSEMRALDAAATRKNLIALAIYALGVTLAFVHPALTMACVFGVAIMYFSPTRWIKT